MAVKVEDAEVGRVQGDNRAAFAPEAPKKTLQQRPVERDARDVAAGSFSAMLTEQTDGDTAEQTVHQAHGVAHREAGESRSEGMEAEEARKRQSPQRVIKIPAEDDSVLNGVRQHKKTQVGRASAYGAAPPPAPKSMVEAHENLMLASTKMEIPEVGSHLLYGPFNKMSGVFKNCYYWARTLSTS